ncbi:hypothetical protein SERLA73DRAFT_180317 [Serpula lacrymans var. lacrymans S7.3]|uniref:Palmitoyl-protein thioesterase 1 n=2 Tax=Serpula lacrymans var. lacrymans TaxID=341189 RepID=F8PU31_SERL3|nr:uncharacterized protein SERLADRAFT_465848 [Serpula lacrymans var. lacrymans S7.9]EGN99970.1 hypothetical protein SERLA73DRAFT_180317 [Serpula lacrymans var. lacrymans S7.3]EGO25535.1 hypothetical protein SERLADRAFT_465848 [Serpula lacrymans var. lacrymans S7.9]
MFSFAVVLFTVLSTLGHHAFCAAVRDIKPLVIWHGLGDSHSSPGMLQFQSEVKKMHPGIFVHSIYIEEDLKADQRAGFYGNVNDQIALVASQLASVPELSRGFDAIGFSQGGQFLRAYTERYNDPPIHNLVTFGAQHMGISDLPLCSAFDLICQIARRAARSGVYGEWAQQNLIQAQYYRDPDQLPLYLTANHFLTDINNEYAPPTDERNATYAENLASLQHLVLVLFKEDTTVVPKESAWFGSEAPPDSGLKDQSSSLQAVLDSNGMPFVSGNKPVQQNRTMIPMQMQPLYIEDWIGLRTLDERGGLTFATCPGQHMQLTGCWEDLVGKWIGGEYL